MVYRLTSIIFGLCLALTLAELGLRLTQPVFPAKRLPLTYFDDELYALASGRSYVTFDANLGWTNAPSTDVKINGVRYRTNRDGIRADAESTPEPIHGVERIAAYGDSFTYCFDVELMGCWTARLARLLPNSEVMNFGVVG